MEVCVDNYESTISAVKGGSMRIELCSSLSEGGLTPSTGFLKVIKQKVKVPIFVMIRPRGGDFVYSDEEVEIMMKDMEILKESGADGFVFGLLTNDGKVDVKNCLKLMKLTGGLPATFSRAFDRVTEPFVALEDVIALGFLRILTSGLQKTAYQGMSLISQLIEAARDRILIMPGSGINKENLQNILLETNPKEFHGSAKVPVNGIYVTDENLVREMVTIYYSRDESSNSEYSPKPASHQAPELNQ